MAARSIWTSDHGHTITRAQGGLDATQKLIATLKLMPKEAAVWNQIVDYWRAQLGFAEKKGRK